MSDTTQNLFLSYLLPNQAQKHVTMNQSLGVLDAAVQVAVVSRNEPEPLPGAVDGDRYIVPATRILQKRIDQS